MSIIIGITGKPNIGKSTFFKSVTLADIDIGNYPFTTINPNYGVAYIQEECQCKKMNLKCNFCIDNIRYIPIKIIDVAGIVQGAHNGKGLGNKFLDDLRQVDAIIHMVDCSGSTDTDGNPVPIGTHDPIKDIIFIQNEIELWIYGIINKNWNKIVKRIKNENLNILNVLASYLGGAGVNTNHIEFAIQKLNLGLVDITKWNNDIIMNFCKTILSISRPMIIVGNKIDKAPNENINKLKNLYPDIFFVSAEVELILQQAKNKNYISYIPGSNTFKIIKKDLTKEHEIGLSKISSFLNKYNSTGVQNCLNSIIFNTLKMIVVYPVEDENKLSNKNGDVLPTTILMKEGSTCQDLANKIHSDIGSTLLYAINAKTKKRISDKYILQNNDIIKIVFSAR